MTEKKCGININPILPIYPKGEKAVPLPRNQMTSLVAGHFFVRKYDLLIFKF